MLKPGFTLVVINISTFSAQEASPRTQSLMAQLSTQEDTRPQVHALPTANPTTAIPESWEQPSRGTMDTEKTDLDSSTDFFGFKRKDPDAVQDSPAIRTQVDYTVPDLTTGVPVSGYLGTQSQPSGPMFQTDTALSTNMFSNVTLPSTQPSPEQHSQMKMQQQLQQQQMMKQQQQQQQQHMMKQQQLQFQRQQQQQLQQLQQNQLQQSVLSQPQVY